MAKKKTVSNGEHKALPFDPDDPRLVVGARIICRDPNLNPDKRWVRGKVVCPNDDGEIIVRIDDDICAFLIEDEWDEIIGFDLSVPLPVPASGVAQAADSGSGSGSRPSLLARTVSSTGQALSAGIALGQGKAAINLLDQNLVPLGALLGFSEAAMKRPEVRRIVLILAPMLGQLVAQSIPGVRDLRYVTRALELAQTVSFAEAIGDGEAIVIGKLAPMITGLVSIGKQVSAITGDDGLVDAITGGVGVQG